MSDFLTYFSYVYQCVPACLCVRHEYKVPTEAVKGYQVSWNYSYRGLWDTMSMLGIKPWSSGRAANALNYWAILQHIW